MKVWGDCPRTIPSLMPRAGEGNGWSLSAPQLSATKPASSAFVQTSIKHTTIRFAAKMKIQRLCAMTRHAGFEVPVVQEVSRCCPQKRPMPERILQSTLLMDGGG